jgi:FlaA1/EpsC-like NDP-sugar epimerase
MMLEDTILVTGGAGSLGRRLTKYLLNRVKTIRVFDNNENGLARLRLFLNNPTNVRLLQGDVRDKDRLIRAMENVDICYHLAALKHVDLCESSPFESLLTNVVGTQNCIDAALAADVDRFIFVSSDKAVNAINTYGRCKALAESLTLDANNYKGDRRCKLSIIRPPNYLNSDGSVTKIWRYQQKHGLPLSVTNPDMCRFFMSFSEMLPFIVKCTEMMKGGEIFVPSNPQKVRIGDLARKFSDNVKIVGVRKGERMEELLIDPTELERAEKINDILVIR